MNTITSAIVRNSDGDVDIPATTALFTKNLARHIAERETEAKIIANAVESLFDEYRGVNINMDAVKTIALKKLNANPDNAVVLGDRILQYVRDNSQGKDLVKRDKSSKGKKVKDDRPPVWENDEYKYFISKGKGGGVRRVADMQPEAKQALVSSVEENETA